MDQLALPFRNSIQQQFERFDTENPHVYSMFKTFALELKNSGRRHIGAKLIAERIRWEAMLKTEGDDFKINNNYVSRYARKLISEMPEFELLIETRGLKA